MIKLITMLLVLLLTFPGHIFAANETPAELNSFLQQPVMLSALDCSQRYGLDFCACTSLESGTTACYYKRPADGPYPLADCERIWGSGQCVAMGNGQYKKASSTSTAGGADCLGQVQIFPGQQFECRLPGMATMWSGTCCKESSGQACSMTETAKLMGLSEAIVPMIEGMSKFLANKYAVPALSEWMYASVWQGLGLDTSGVGDYVKEALVQQGLSGSSGTSLLGSLVGSGTSGFGMADSMLKEAASAGVKLSSQAQDAALQAAAKVLANGGTDADAAAAASQALFNSGGLTIPQAQSIGEAGVDAVRSAAGQGTDIAQKAVGDALSSSAVTAALSIGFALLDGELSGEELASAMADTVVAFASSMGVPGLGWAYMAYKIYNSVSKMMDGAKCNSGEAILACKVGEGLCHYVGTKCMSKLFGTCLQKVKRYCCFNTKLARIINEQGRPQIGKGWGDGEDPDCSGFSPAELAQVDFSSMDLGEVVEDISRRTTIDMSAKIRNALDRVQDRTGQ